MRGYTWVQGCHPAAMTPRGVVVMAPGNLRLARQCWGALHEGGDLVVIMGKLIEDVGADLTSLPGFVAVVVTGTHLHVAIRGDYELTVRGSEGTESITGGTVTWWTERRFSDVVGWRIATPPEEAFNAEVWSAVDACAPVAIVENMHDWTEYEPENWKQSVEPRSPIETLGAEQAGTGHDRTLGETNYFAGISEDEGTGCSSLPGIPVNEPEEQTGDLDGHTIHSTKIGQLQVKARELAVKPELVGASSTAPKVLALLCINGHPNPTHAQNCRECSSMMSETSVVIPQPKLGTLVLSNGTREELYKDIIIGRAPKINETMVGRQRAVTVPSPKKEISRNHCEIRVTGWDVRLRDLGSNNGTLLVRPGQNPVLVSETAPVMMQPGDIIDLGEGLTIWLEG